MKKKILLGALALLLAISLVAIGCPAPTPTPTPTAEEWPVKRIEWVVHASPGGGSDICARTVALRLRRILDADIIITNRTGGAGAVAMEYVQKQPADGYTWYFTSNSSVGTMVEGTVPYTLDDWMPVLNFQLDPRWLVASADDERFRSIEDVLQFAKENPGKLTVAGCDPLPSVDGVMWHQFLQRTGLDISYVPFDCSAPALAAFLGGHTDLHDGSMVGFIDLIKAGEVVPLLLFWDTRAEDFPDVPATGQDLGHESYLPVNRGMTVKAGTPPEIVKKIHDACVKAMEHSHYKSYVEYSVLDMVPGYRSTGEYGLLLQTMWDNLEEILK